MSGDVRVSELPRCETCSTPRIGTGPCLYCRAVEAEQKLAAVSFFGEDDWMRKLASLMLDEDGVIRERRDRLIPLGFSIDLPQVGTTTTINVIARPQVNFRPEILTVAPECADVGMLIDAKVGNRSQFINSDLIPLSLFNPLAWGSIEVMREVQGRMAWDTATVAQDITLTIDATRPLYDPLTQVAREAMNLPTPTKFMAALWGRVVDHGEYPRVDGYGLAPPPPIHHGSVENLEEVMKTLKFASVVNQICKRDAQRR